MIVIYVITKPKQLINHNPGGGNSVLVVVSPNAITIMDQYSNCKHCKHSKIWFGESQTLPDSISVDSVKLLLMLHYRQE